MPAGKSVRRRSSAQATACRCRVRSSTCPPGAWFVNRQSAVRTPLSTGSTISGQKAKVGITWNRCWRLPKRCWQRCQAMWRRSSYPHRPGGFSGQQVPQAERDLITAEGVATGAIHDAINAGVGIVYGKQEHLEDMPPWQGGGNMIQTVTFEQSTYSQPPAKFEAGTQSPARSLAINVAPGKHSADVDQLLEHNGAHSFVFIPLAKLTGKKRRRDSRASALCSEESHLQRTPVERGENGKPTKSP